MLIIRCIWRNDPQSLKTNATGRCLPDDRRSYWHWQPATVASYRGSVMFHKKIVWRKQCYRTRWKVVIAEEGRASSERSPSNLNMPVIVITATHALQTTESMDSYDCRGVCRSIPTRLVGILLAHQFHNWKRPSIKDQKWPQIVGITLLKGCR